MNVRLSLALDHIITSENVQANREDYDEYVADYAQRQRISNEEAVKRLGGESAIIEQLLHAQAIEVVKQYAQPTEMPFDSIGI